MIGEGWRGPSLSHLRLLNRMSFYFPLWQDPAISHLKWLLSKLDDQSYFGDEPCPVGFCEAIEVVGPQRPQRPSWSPRNHDAPSPRLYFLVGADASIVPGIGLEGSGGLADSGGSGGMSGRSGQTDKLAKGLAVAGGATGATGVLLSSTELIALGLRLRQAGAILVLGGVFLAIAVDGPADFTPEMTMP
jgi:hypothetical protein